jgi:beta-galactosidase
VNLDRMRRDVEDPRVVGWGRMPQRAERSESDTIERISLRGTWDFGWSPTFAEGPWGEIEVPAVWELNGYGTPYYLAFRYPPAIGKDGRLDPADRPTGIYRRRLDIPADWAGRRITLRFESVKSAFHLLLDGELTGYGEGSMTGAAATCGTCAPDSGASRSPANSSGSTAARSSCTA